MSRLAVVPNQLEFQYSVVPHQREIKTVFVYVISTLARGHSSLCHKMYYSSLICFDASVAVPEIGLHKVGKNVVVYYAFVMRC